jgi:hypothetical protein
MATFRDYAWGLFAGAAVLVMIGGTVLTIGSLVATGWRADGVSSYISMGLVVAMQLAIGIMVAVAAWHRTVWGCTLDHDGADESCQRHEVQ